jgi:hypothetical protein
MWYFTYDHRSSWREMIRIYRNLPARVPLPLSRRAAVLKNYRICFPQFSEEHGGGVASIVPEPGKSVAGALFDLPRRAVERLDEIYGRCVDFAGREPGASRRIEIEVLPFEQGPSFLATAHQPIASVDRHIPPTREYLNLLINTAAELQLSSLWIDQLRSFAPAEQVRLCRIAV